MNLMAETYMMQRELERQSGRAGRARLAIAAENGRQSAALAAIRPLAGTNWFIRYRRATAQMFTGYLTWSVSRMTQSAKAAAGAKV